MEWVILWKHYLTAPNAEYPQLEEFIWRCYKPTNAALAVKMWELSLSFGIQPYMGNMRDVWVRKQVGLNGF